MALPEALLRRIAPLLWRAQVLRFRLFRAVTLGVKVIVIGDEGVLLVRQTYRKGWYLPGGGVKPGERPEDAARRELREEVGIMPVSLRFLGLYTSVNHGMSDHVALFAAGAFTQEDVQSWEIAEARFFGPDTLPRDTAPGDRRHIEMHRSGTLEVVGRW